VTPAERYARLTTDQQAAVRAAWPAGLPMPKHCTTPAQAEAAHATIDETVGWEEPISLDDARRICASALRAAGIIGDDHDDSHAVIHHTLGVGIDPGDLTVDDLRDVAATAAWVRRGHLVLRYDADDRAFLVTAHAHRLERQLADTAAALADELGRSACPDDATIGAWRCVVATTDPTSTTSTVVEVGKAAVALARRLDTTHSSTEE